jgi:hypothetical protein
MSTTNPTWRGLESNGLPIEDPCACGLFVLLPCVTGASCAPQERVYDSVTLTLPVNTCTAFHLPVDWHWKGVTHWLAVLRKKEWVHSLIMAVCCLIWIPSSLMLMSCHVIWAILQSVLPTRPHNQNRVPVASALDQWHSIHFVRVSPNVISLQLCTPKVVGVQFKLYAVYNLHLKEIK